MPSRAITKTWRLGNSVISVSLTSREAMPISEVPSPAALTPTLEPPPCTSMRTPALAAMKASASFSAKGWTVVEPEREIADSPWGASVASVTLGASVASATGAAGVGVLLLPHAAISARHIRPDKTTNKLFLAYFIFNSPLCILTKWLIPRNVNRPRLTPV